MFLVDGSTNLTQPGAAGGNLGYSPSDQSGGTGVANGLIGVGIDEFGNFSTTKTLQGVAANPVCTAPLGQSGSAGTGTAPDPNKIVIRGPGNDVSGYCYLGASATLGALHGTTRADATHTVRVVVDPATVATRNVTVYLDGSQAVQIPAPAELLAATSFKFGFSASIGGANDNHDVWDLSIASVNPIEPVTPVAPPAPVVVAPSFTG